MKKSIIAVIAACAVLMLCLVGCSTECNHKWEAATCEEAKHCTECGITEAERDPEAHMWNEADCQQARTCARCGLTDGEPNLANHAWEDATCLVPMTCWKCGEQKGDVIGHKYDKGICETCGVSEANASNTSA